MKLPAYCSEKDGKLVLWQKYGGQMVGSACVVELPRHALSEEAMRAYLEAGEREFLGRIERDFCSGRSR